jgi:phosphoribosylformylglycinamidine cyclo-ligase
MTTYADSGVNIELGDDASKVMYEAAKLTWQNREGILGEVVSPKDDFSGARVINVGGLPDGAIMCMGFDGVGTKVEIAERMGRHDTMAFDLFAMVCDDAVVYGGEPVLVGSILDVNSLSAADRADGAADSNLHFMKQLAAGYVSAAEAGRVAVINGEIAELGARVAGYGEDFNYNWGASVVWFADKERLFTGDQIQPGDKVISLREKGFRSNGLSLLRKIMVENHGENWHEKELPGGEPHEAGEDDNHGGRLMGDLALEPSTIYSAAVCDMFGGFDKEPRCEVHGVAHITGGGIPGKLGRVLKRAGGPDPEIGLGARLDNLFEPCELMKHAMEVGGVSRGEAYQTWNMGNGMLIIVADGEEEAAIAVAKEHGIEARVCGEIVEEDGIEIL